MAISTGSPFKIILAQSALPATKEEGAVYVWKNGLYLATSTSDVAMLGQVENVAALASVTDPVAERYYIDTTAGTLNRWTGTAWQTIGGNTLAEYTFSITGKATATGVLFDGTADVALNVTTLDASGLTGAIPDGVTATTQSQGDNSTQLATTAYVDSAKTAVYSDMYTKTQVDAKVASVMHYKGTVATLAALEEVADPVIGDVWNVTATGDNYAYSEAGAWDKLAGEIDLTNYVTLDSAQTITGAKTFSETIVGNVNGSAARLGTARTIGITDADSVTQATAASFDGSANVSITMTALNAALLTGTASVNTTGNAATATSANTSVKLTTARAINVSGEGLTGTAQSFDGTVAITIPIAFTTQSAGDNSTKPATTAYVDSAVSAAVLAWEVIS